MNQDPFQNPEAGGNPYQPTSAPPENDPIHAEIKKQAMASMIWGIVGIFCCGIILGPFAIYRGNKAKKMMAEHNKGQEFSGQATAGIVCGIIGLVLNILGIGLQIVFIALGAATNAQGM